MDKRSEALTRLTEMVARMRDDSLDAIIGMGHGNLVIQVPRSSGQPVEAGTVTGGLQFVVQEIRPLR